MPQPAWDDASLDRFRQEGDPLADDVIASIHRRGDLSAVTGLLGQLVRNDEMLPEGLPPEVAAYLEASGQVAQLADESLLRRGEALFMRHGPLSLACLLAASLPECYVNARAVPVIFVTQGLEAHARRRLFETAQMVVDVMAPGGLSPKGKGVRAAQRVRLMHAAMRFLLTKGDIDAGAAPPQGLADAMARAKWDGTLGVPINQEDLAYTLLTFSHVILRGIQDLGVVVEARDRDAFIHCWNVVGAIMGVRSELLAADAAEAAELFAIIKRRHAAASPDGQALTRVLLATFADALGPGPGRHVPAVLARQLVGTETAGMLGIVRGDSAWDRLVEWLLHALRWLEHRVSLAARGHSRLQALGTEAGTLLVRAFTRMPRGAERGLFAIPPTLAAEWGLGEAGAARPSPP